MKQWSVLANIHRIILSYMSCTTRKRNEKIRKQNWKYWRALYKSDSFVKQNNLNVKRAKHNELTMDKVAEIMLRPK